MRVTIVRDDGVVGVDGIFRHVDMEGLPEGVRAVQWDGAKGHVEHEEENTPLADIEEFRVFLDRWTAAAPPVAPEPAPEQRRLAAHMRINAAYEAAVAKLVGGYPSHEIDSWAKQEAEARAWLADNAKPTPWIDGAATARGISKPAFVAKVIEQADALAPMHGALSGKRQYLRDRIDALVDPTQEQLDAIEW